MESRWNAGGFCAERPLLPDEAVVRERYLGKGVDAPDLPIVKEFICFLAAASYGKIVELPTISSINTYREWFFTGFTRVTENYAPIWWPWHV
jgi:hypothetical protein